MRLDEVSRWSVLVEVISTLKEVLAPAIPLPQLLERGRSIALSLRVERAARPLQLRKMRAILANSLG